MAGEFRKIRCLYVTVKRSLMFCNSRLLCWTCCNTGNLYSCTSGQSVYWACHSWLQNYGAGILGQCSHHINFDPLQSKLMFSSLRNTLLIVMIIFSTCYNVNGMDHAGADPAFLKRARGTNIMVYDVTCDRGATPGRSPTPQARSAKPSAGGQWGLPRKIFRF